MQPVRCKTSATEEDLSKPLPFSKSKAASWSAANSFSGREKPSDVPWYQPLAISFSLTAILLWFCVLREENDIDRKMDKTLYDRVAGLEKHQLELCLAYNEKNGIDNTAVRQRLAELKAEQ